MVDLNTLISIRYHLWQDWNTMPSFNRHYFNKKWLKIKQSLLENAIISHSEYDIDVFFDMGFTTPFKTVYYLESIIDFSEWFILNAQFIDNTPVFIFLSFLDDNIRKANFELPHYYSFNIHSWSFDNTRRTHALLQSNQNFKKNHLKL